MTERCIPATGHMQIRATTMMVTPESPNTKHAGPWTDVFDLANTGRIVRRRVPLPALGLE